MKHERKPDLQFISSGVSYRSTVSGLDMDFGPVEERAAKQVMSDLIAHRQRVFDKTCPYMDEYAAAHSNEVEEE